MTSHLELAELAELAEGLLDDEEAAAARAHLDGCAVCRRRADAITDVSHLLRDAAPPPLPDDVATRLDAAIEGETRRGTVTPLRSARRRAPMLVMAAASILLLVAAGVGVAQLVGVSGGGRVTASRVEGAGGDAARASASPYRPLALPSEAVTASGRDYSVHHLSKQAASLLRSRRAHENGSEQPERGGASPQPRPSVSSSGDSGKPQGQTTEPGRQKRSVTVQSAAPTPSPLRTLATPETLTECVDKIVETVAPGTEPLAVDLAHYGGEPAAVIILPELDLTKAKVLVVNPTCTEVRAERVISLADLGLAP